MKTLLNFKGAKMLITCLTVLLVAGCADGDRFDQLKLVDGNGDVYILKHNFGDTYYVDNLTEIDREKKKLPNAEVNKKLEESIGG